MGRVLGDLTPGTLVYLEETVSGTTTYVPYIWLGEDEHGKGRILREKAAVARRMHSSNVSEYNGCEADLWLENTETGFLSRFDSATRAAFDITTIAYNHFDETGTAGIVEIARTCFLLSYTELYGAVGSTGNEGKSYLGALETYKNTTNANTARIAYNAANSAVWWWMRSAGSTTYFRYVYSNGNAGNDHATYSGIWLRPAIVVQKSTPVSDEGQDFIYLFPDPDKGYRELGVTIDMGSREETPKQIRVSVATSNLDTITCEVTTNLNDAEPTWIKGNLDNPIRVTSIAPEEGCELGVRLYARSNGRGYIGEPIIVCL